ncbi:mitofilin family membrane protein [Phenylobacterium sp.]|uniref:COG4223 family protein n=1 Tax=Phenylobacterium sp. TaxID=1871053 RepID=UPI00289EBB30|nr:mitofilin family membrane protein [Phenylobacterium sp.]
MSDQLSAPRDPGSYGRRRSLGLGVGALILFGAACAAGGYGLARFGPALPELYPDKPRTGAVSEAAPLAALPAPPAEPAPLAPPAPPPAAPDAASGSAVSQRLEALESDRSRLASASASALAASALLQAAQGSRPFATEVKAMAAIAPSLDLGALQAEAERGAPSRAALAASFPDYAARAASAARAPGEGAGVLARVGHALSRVVALRRVGEAPGDGPDAILARAERQIEDGDVVGALAVLDALPADAKDALGPWRDRAERRAKIDREIARIRAQALQELSQLARSGG